MNYYSPAGSNGSKENYYRSTENYYNDNKKFIIANGPPINPCPHRVAYAI